MALGITIDFNALGVRFTDQVDRMGQGLDNFRVRAESMSQRVDKAFSAMGVGLSVAGIGAFVKSGIDAADALNDMADRTGIAIEKLAGFEFAVGLGDTSMEAFAGAANKLSIAIAKNGEDLEQLGISAKDPADAFLQFADVFSSIEDDQKRAAFGNQVLGKSYAEMSPLLAMGSERLRELVKEGQEMSGVTEEQARVAGEFNDKLDIMAARSIGLRSRLAMGILEPMTEIAAAMEAAISRSGDWMDSLDGAINGMRNHAFGTGGGLTAELDVLNVKIAEAKENLQDAKEGGIFGKSSADEIAAQKSLNALLSERSSLMEKISAGRRKDSEAPKATAPSAAALDRLINGENPTEKAANAAAKAEESRLKTVNETIAALRMDIEISSLSEAQQRRFIELSNSLKNAKGGEIQVITDLVNKKHDDIEVSQRQQVQWAQLIEDANAYYDLRKEIDGLSKTDLTLDSFGTGLDKIQAQLDEGIIKEGQAKALFDQLGRAYNDSFIEPAKVATDDLSAYAEQAARNMQDSFADFLFDPFQEGTDGMLTSFLSTIQRMAAEYASSQIFDLFRDKDSGGGGLGSAIGSGLSSFLGGLFHDGGIVGYSGGTAAIPFPAAAFAPAYHTGGIAGLQSDEMFAKLRIGEEVLTRSDPRHRWNNPPAAGTEANPANVTVINNFTLSQPADRRTQDQIAAMAGNSIKRALQRNG
jgi:hypothetical protein